MLPGWGIAFWFSKHDPKSVNLKWLSEYSKIFANDSSILGYDTSILGIWRRNTTSTRERGNNTQGRERGQGNEHVAKQPDSKLSYVIFGDEVGDGGQQHYNTAAAHQGRNNSRLGGSPNGDCGSRNIITDGGRTIQDLKLKLTENFIEVKSPYDTLKIAYMWFSDYKPIERICAEIMKDNRNYKKLHYINNFIGNKVEIVKTIQDCSDFEEGGGKNFLYLLQINIFDLFTVRHAKTTAYCTGWVFLSGGSGISFFLR